MQFEVSFQSPALAVQLRFESRFEIHFKSSFATVTPVQELICHGPPRSVTDSPELGHDSVTGVTGATVTAVSH